MKELPEHRGSLLEEDDYFGTKRFRETALAAFPGLAAHVSAKDGIHLVMAALSQEARGALQRADVERAVAICRFLDHAMARPDAVPEIENAVAISFLESSDFVESPAGRELQQRMPESVRRVLFQEDEI